MIKKLFNRRDFVKTLTTVAASSAIPPFLFGERVTFLDSTLSSKPKETELSKQISEQKAYLALGKPNPDIPFTEGPCAVFGRYTADSKITFEGKCQYPWEFMATGTGVSGLTIAAGRDVSGQLNHSSAFDESGVLRSLGVFRLSWWSDRENGERPWPEKKFAGLEKEVRMVHDLRKSVITITSEGGKGKIQLEVRAYKKLDVIRIDVKEDTPIDRQVSGRVHLQVQKEYPFQDLIENDTYLSWHVNPSNFSAGRCFGTAMSFDLPEGCSQEWMSGRGTIVTGGKYKRNNSLNYTLWVVPGSNAHGLTAWREDVLSRLAKARAMGNELITSHEAWWEKFWKGSNLEIPDDDGSHLRHLAAFELYRYYLACSADRRSEVPLSYLNNILGNNVQYPYQMKGGKQVTSLENFSAWCGTIRTGDLDILGSCLASYIRLLPAMRRWVKSSYRLNGAIRPYNYFVQTELVKGDIDVKILDDTTLKSNAFASYGIAKFNINANLYDLTLFCDYLDLGGDDPVIVEGVFTYAEAILTLFRELFPRKSANGRTDFTPSGGGESYAFVSDSCELIVGMKITLPRLISLGRMSGWDKSTIKVWQKMYLDLPDLPRGTVKIDESDDLSVRNRDLLPFDWHFRKVKIFIEKSDLLAPARQFDSNWNILNNSQNNELLSVWPGKLMLRNKKDKDVAIRTYYARLTQHTLPTGWSLDIPVAASLGLKEEVKKWWPYHFDLKFTFPCGLAQERCNYMPERPSIPFSASNSAMGAGVTGVLEMLIQDYPDLLIVLPCWENNVAVRYTLYSPYAGKVMVDYDPQKGAFVKTERPIKIEYGDGIRASKS
ncbi:MAG: hypothetical protein WCK78_08725 [Paludibacter sp.]